MEKFKQFEPYEIGISSIVLSELRYGVAKSQNRENNIKRLNAFLMPFKVLSYDYSAAKVYGDIRAALEKKGTPIGREDLLIAAHAISEGVPIVTNNEKEFLRVPQLKVENWVTD